MDNDKLKSIVESTFVRLASLNERNYIIKFNNKEVNIELGDFNTKITIRGYDVSLAYVSISYEYIETYNPADSNTKKDLTLKNFIEFMNNFKVYEPNNEINNIISGLKEWE